MAERFPKSTKPSDRSLKKAIHKTKTSPALAIRYMRKKIEVMEREILRCDSPEQVDQKVKNLTKEIAIMRKITLKMIKRFSRALGDIAFKDGQKQAQKDMRSKGIHFPGEKK